MPSLRRQAIVHNAVLWSVLVCIVGYIIFLLFLSPTFYDSDSYYHIAVSRFIKDSGPRYPFRWAEFSTYKDLFADKDFLFHALSVPFLFITPDPVLAGKLAIIFYALLFLSVYCFLLKRYLPGYLVACLLILPFLSATFTMYILYLRSFTLANILTILGVYFLIKKRLVGLAVVSLLYPLSHTSFFTMLIFAVACEAIRFFFNREFYLRNIYTVIIALLVGCLIHPNFPNNLLYEHLQFLVIKYAREGLDLNLGSELFTYSTLRVLQENFSLLLTLNLALWMAFVSRKRISFQTAVWLFCANFYLVLAFTADRHWYPANILGFIFFASYLVDWLDGRSWQEVVHKVRLTAAIYLAAAVFFLPAGVVSINASIDLNTQLGNHFKDVALWMKRNLPKDKLVYHNNWSDPAYFICFNPDNRYLVVLDPLYMYYRYPETYIFYRDLSRGLVSDVYNSLKVVFRCEYGYTNKGNLFFARVKKDPLRFRILYEDELGIVFKLNDPSKPAI